MTLIIALALSTGVLAKSEADGFTPPLPKPEISGKGLFQSPSGIYGTAFNNNSDSGSPDNNISANIY